MKIVDLTGDNRGVVGFHVDVAADGSCIGRFEVDKIDGANFLPGQYVPVDAPSVNELQVKFDKPESVASFFHQLQRGYNKMAILQAQKKVRDEALASLQANREEMAKRVALKERIEQMAKELSALQGQYAELND